MTVNRFAPEQLIVRACEATGLDDFGDDDTWRDGLDLVCDGLTTDARLNEIGVEIAAVHGNRRVESIDLVASTDNAKSLGQLGVAAIFVFIGAEPRSSWLPETVARDERGYVLTGADVVRAGKWPLTTRDPCPLETSVPRVLVGGDLRSGSTKRVGFAVGDGSLAVTCVHSLRTRRRSMRG